MTAFNPAGASLITTFAQGSLNLFNISGSFRQNHLGFVSPKFRPVIDAVCVAEIASSRCALLAMTAFEVRSNPSASLRAKRSNLAARTESKFVMAGHSRPKDGVASLAYVPAIHVFGD